MTKIKFALLVYIMTTKTVDWKKREEELIELLDKYRRNDGYYDVIVPGSGEGLNICCTYFKT